MPVVSRNAAHPVAVTVSSFIGAQRNASIVLGLADHMYAVIWHDHSGQSLCSPVNIGAMPIVRVSTSGAVVAFGVLSTCLFRHEYCFVIRRTLRTITTGASTESAI